MNGRFSQKYRVILIFFILCVAYLAVGVVPLTVGIFRPGITGYDRAMLEDMVYGRAHKPFVKRQLVPLVVRASKQLMPIAVQERLKDKFASSKLVKRLNWPVKYAPEFVLTLLVMYGSLIGFLVVLRSFLLVFFDMPCGLSHLVVLGVGIGLPITFAGQLYIYDFTQLLLFTAGVILLFRQQWSWFYPVYILSCINKETSVLIAFVFAFWLGLKVLRRPYLWHFLSQILIGFGICFITNYVFKDNSGGNLEWHLQRNIALSISVLGWVRVVVLLFAIILCLLGLSQSPLFLRRAIIVILPPLVIAAFFFGYLDELRDYYEALPFVVGLSLLTVGKLVGIQPKLVSVKGRDFGQ